MKTHYEVHLNGRLYWSLDVPDPRTLHDTRILNKAVKFAEDAITAQNISKATVHKVETVYEVNDSNRL